MKKPRRSLLQFLKDPFRFRELADIYRCMNVHGEVINQRLADVRAALELGRPADAEKAFANLEVAKTKYKELVTDRLATFK